VRSVKGHHPASSRLLYVIEQRRGHQNAKARREAERQQVGRTGSLQRAARRHAKTLVNKVERIGNPAQPRGRSETQRRRPAQQCEHDQRYRQHAARLQHGPRRIKQSEVRKIARKAHAYPRPSDQAANAHFSNAQYQPLIPKRNNSMKLDTVRVPTSPLCPKRRQVGQKVPRRREWLAGSILTARSTG